MSLSFDHNCDQMCRATSLHYYLSLINKYRFRMSKNYNSLYNLACLNYKGALDFSRAIRQNLRTSVDGALGS